MLIDRPLYMQQLTAAFAAPLIKVITGQRRSGKSSLLQLIAKQYTTYILDMEDFSHYNLQTAEALHAHLLTHVDMYEVICIDEVQQVTQREKVIISLAKKFPTKQRIVTWSNSHLLSSELTTLLRWRYIQIHVYPFTYTEFCAYHTYSADYHSFLAYMQLGSFPLTYTFTDDNLQKQWIEGMIDTIFLKDIIERYPIKHTEILRELFLFIVNNAGNITNLSNIQKILSLKSSISLSTLQEYMRHLENSYLVYRAELYDIRWKQLFDRLSKRYPSDHSRRKVLFGEFDQGIGKVLETIVYMRCKAKWRSVHVGRLGEKEIDFVLTKQGKTMYLQVAYLLSDQKVISREFGDLSSIEDQRPKYVATMDQIHFGTINGIPHLHLRELDKIL
jgi:predicted AAA+ superfamily ATPase